MKKVILAFFLGLFVILIQGCSEVQTLAVQLLKTQQPQQQVDTSNEKAVETIDPPVVAIPNEVLLSSSELTIGYCDNTYNAEIALKAINAAQVVLQSGEVFSFNQIVGERTPEKGYIIGEYVDGSPSMGSGICRLVVALCKAVIGKLEIIERNYHFPIPDYSSPAFDATVDYDHNLDFKFRNTTNNPIKIYTESEHKEETVILKVWIVELVEK